MLRPAHLMIQTRRQLSPGQIAAIFGTVILEAGVIYAVATSLKLEPARVALHPTQIEILQPTRPKVQPIAMPEPPLVKPATVTVPQPDIPFETPQPTPRVTGDRMPAHPALPGAGEAAVALPKLRGITAPVSIGGSHSCVREYPAIAVRLNEQGTTTLRFTVDSDGSVSNVQVLNSSGYDALDQAAIRCASSWRYKPAVEGGQPVSATWTTMVLWKLKSG